MPQIVVNLLEIVDVHYDHGSRTIPSLRHQRLPHPLMAGGRIVYSRQAVRLRLRFQLFLDFPLRLNIDQLPYRVPRPSRSIGNHFGDHLQPAHISSRKQAFMLRMVLLLRYHIAKDRILLLQRLRTTYLLLTP